jgi:hypothetical protein
MLRFGFGLVENPLQRRFFFDQDIAIHQPQELVYYGLYLNSLMER